MIYKDESQKSVVNQVNEKEDEKLRNYKSTMKDLLNELYLTTKPTKIKKLKKLIQKTHSSYQFDVFFPESDQEK